MYVMRSLFEDGTSSSHGRRQTRRGSAEKGGGGTAPGGASARESQTGQEKELLPLLVRPASVEEYSFKDLLEELSEEAAAVDYGDVSGGQYSLQLLACLKQLKSLPAGGATLDGWNDLENELQRYHQALLESATSLAEMISRADRLTELLIHTCTAHVMNFQGDVLDLTDTYKSLLARIPSPVLPPILTLAAAYRELRLFPFLSFRAFPGSLRTAAAETADVFPTPANVPLFIVAIPCPTARAGLDATFPIEDFFPNLKQDYKDACRDTFQCGDKVYKGSQHSTYKNTVAEILGQLKLENPKSQQEQLQLRRHLVRILTIMHFLQRTFSGAIIFQCLKDLLNLEDSSSSNDVHLVPRSADAGSIKIHFLGSCHQAALYASSNLSFTLVHNDQSTGIRVKGRLTLNIPNLSDFGHVQVLDQIGDCIGINSPPFRTTTEDNFLDLLWPLQHSLQIPTQLSTDDFFSVARYIHLYFETIN